MARIWKVAIFGEDSRRSISSLQERLSAGDITPEVLLASQLTAIGSITCKRSRAITSGFLVDITRYLPPGSQIDFDVVSTSAHSFYTEGKYHGPCFFHPLGERRLPLRIGSIRVGTKSGSLADSSDIAWGAISTVSDKYHRIKIEFADKYDYARPELGANTFIDAYYSRRMRQVVTSSGCAADDKHDYNIVESGTLYGLDFSKMVIHDCDLKGGSSGGVLLRRHTDGALKAIASNTGESATNHEDTASGEPYDPPTAFNYARRFDDELEDGLIDYIDMLLSH